MRTKFFIGQIVAWMVAMAFNQSHAQGSPKAMHFPGSGVLTPSPTATTNSFVDLGTPLSDSLATTDFTIELWAKMGATNAVNPVLIGNKDWASGANTGFILSYYASTDASSGTAAANTLRFNFKPVGGTRVDYDIVFPLATALKWNHIAITVNRSGAIQGYLNGVPVGQSYVAGTSNIAADAGKSIAGTLPVRLGTDGKPFGYRAPFNGDLDEVRIWKRALSATDIRQGMCQKLQGNENELLAYYRMDDAGSTITNSALATSGSFTGTLVNDAARVASGAPVGDTAVNVYANNWAGQSLQLATGNRGSFTIDSFGTTGSFLHLYQINKAPDSTTGLTPFSNNDVYFGAFASGDSFVYFPRYAYANYTEAQNFKSSIGFFSRVFNADPIWFSKTNLWNDTASHVMRLDSIQGSRQFFLANFLNGCNAPQSLTATNVQATTAELGWTSGGAALWNLEYGPTGFLPGTGTVVSGINSNPYGLTGLTGSTTYDFYVKDTCVGIGSSPWAGPYTFSTLADLSGFGSGYALRFNGTGVQNSPVQAVNLGGALRDSIATSNFTIEMWVKVGATNTGNPPLIADKDYVNGANTGICWTYTASVLWGNAEARTFRFNFKPIGGTRKDYDMVAPNEFTWNHLAITVDREGVIKGYVNGVFMPSLSPAGGTSIAADTGKTLAGSMPLYLGTDGTGSYRVPFNGSMDEVRVWKNVRTEEEIRQYMCQKLTGDESGLMAYYRMDESAGSVVYNSASATLGLMNGTLVNQPNRPISEAPLGDTSLYVYPAAGWDNVALELAAQGKGRLVVDSVSSPSVPGIHLYRVNGTPNFSEGIVDMGATDTYFGVFTADVPNAAYKVRYDYSGYPSAAANNANLHLYNRRDNAAATWAQLPATHDMPASALRYQATLGNRQYLLADFSTPNCPAPSALEASNVGYSDATITWSSSAAVHSTRYGKEGFEMNLAPDTAVYANQRSLTGLLPNTTYEFYVRDSCGPNSASAWVGPCFLETLDACPEVTAVRADSTTTTTLIIKWTDEGPGADEYEVSWGKTGTFAIPTNGIMETVPTPRLPLSGLQVNTSYDFYIKSNCDAYMAQSGWAGPFSFRTDSTDAPSVGLPDIANEDKVRVYPNPTSGKVHIIAADAWSSPRSEALVYNSLGNCVFRKPFEGGHMEIDAQDLPDGVYHIVIISEKGRLHKSFVVTH